MKNNKGFTLLEILLVVAAIAILAGIVIVAINPSKQLGDTRNAQRRSDVNTILNAVYQYSIDNSGDMPWSGVMDPGGGNGTEVCVSATSSECTGASKVDLSPLLLNEAFLVAIPSDPSGGCGTFGGCYTISTSTNGRVTVRAPGAEEGADITVKK